MSEKRICAACNENEAKTILLNIGGFTAKSEGLCEECLRKRAAAGLGGNNGFLDMLAKNFSQAGFSSMSDQARPRAGKTEKGESKSSEDMGILSEFCVDLTEKAKKKELDPVIGRALEIERVIHILNRRTKNNPVLIGEPGVGKTAVAEALAQRIAAGEVPEKLKGKKLLEFRVKDVTAGTAFRGQFEERINRMMEEVERRGDIVLFIDELHTILGAGAAGQAEMDLANILKPHLARGKTSVVGATTLEEYRKIEKDSALERRFHPVKLEEPSTEETVEILKGLRERYEEFHRIKYSDEAIEACAKLAERYISDRFMPDKAIDLMDEAGSKINLENQKTTYAEELKSLRKLEEEASAKRDHSLALQYSHRQQLLAAQMEGQFASEILPAHVEAVVESMTGIPVAEISENEKKSLISLSEKLESRVIGQNKAVKETVRAIKRNRLGLKKKRKPVSLFFAGPTGVGKTELTRRLAAELFGSEDAIIRQDMSELMEQHSVSKLIGSPPGYVGHEKAGSLTEKVRRKPYSIVLLDEVEKAHPDVLDLFLQVLEDGRLTDSQGRTVDFSHCVIVMTSNLGAQKPKKSGFLKEEPGDHYLAAIQAHFRPEFVNRLDAVVPFVHLEPEHVEKIAEIQIAELADALKEKEIALDVSEEAKSWIAAKGYDKKYGARPLSRAIASHLEDPISDLLLEGEPAARITVAVREGELLIQPA